MKKLLSILVLVLLASTSRAQVVSSAGTFVAAGAPISGCSAINAIVSVVNGTLTCSPNLVVNGSVSTAGRSILTISDTISGSSATSNFLNLTSTFNATLSAETNAALFSTTVDNDNQLQSGVKSTLAGTGGTLTTAALWADSAATGGISAGVVGLSTGAATIRNGGFFGLGAVVPTVSGALVADNGAVATNIFMAKDNGTAVFTIADGGAITATGGFNNATSSSGITSQAFIAAGNTLGLYLGGTTGQIGAVWQSTTNTPDSPILVTNTLSNSWHINEYADNAFDFQNPCTTGLGTAACTDPALIIHSHNQDTGEFLSMAHDGKAAVIVGGNSTALNGTFRLGGSVALSAGSATAVLTVPTANNTSTGGTIMYTVDSGDATNSQARSGQVRFAVATNNAAAETCVVYGVDQGPVGVGGPTLNPDQTEDGSGAGAMTSGTMTYAWSVDVTGTNTCVLKLNAASSLTETRLNIHYTVILSGPGVPTGG
jgi:hypothetical protein